MNSNPAEPFFYAMHLTPQPLEWHGEGDVLTHTRMVVDALDRMTEVEALTDDERQALYSAAWLHDIGKIPQTKEFNGRVEAPSHAPVGSRMARQELWRNHGLCGDTKLMQLREAVALLVRYHSLPPHIIDSPTAALALHRIASNSLLCPIFSIKLLSLLCRADMIGRICPDSDKMLYQIALCEELAKEEGCFEGAYPFPSEVTRRAVLQGKEVWKDQALHDSAWGIVYMMSGLPGTGKDTWIGRNLPDVPIVSLDEIRREYGIAPDGPQGFVANEAKERAKQYLRRHQPFVWNATNITSATRAQLISLFESYGARVHIIYLETSWPTLLERNSGREYSVPQPVIENMLSKLSLPEAHEATRVDWIGV